MVLNIENLGIIKKASIDLDKKMILFCGRNSTGKTYASYVLHAFLEDGHLYPLNCMKEIIDEVVAKGGFHVKREYVEEWLRMNCRAVTEQLGSIFGISDTTKDKLFADFKLEAIYSDDDYAKTLTTQIGVQLKEESVFWSIKKDSDSDFVKIESNVDLSVLQPSSIRAASLLCLVLRHLAFCNKTGVRMLTVERNSIYTFKTELSLSRNELIDHIQQSDKSELDIISLINKSSRRYPQAVRSSLRIANDLENVSKNTTPFAPMADMIEKDLLFGEVSMTKSGDVEFHAQGMAKSRRLPFHLSSSIVKTMASLVIYLRHIANKGDTLIVDEPEMNFHPDVQVLLARVFALLSNKGIRVIVSSHSDYIAREMNSLVMAQALLKRGDTEIVRELGYQEDMLLDSDNIAVLSFKKKGVKSVYVTPLTIDDEGFAIDTIDSTIEEQNIRAERLYAHLLNND